MPSLVLIYLITFWPSFYILSTFIQVPFPSPLTLHLWYLQRESLLLCFSFLFFSFLFSSFLPSFLLFVHSFFSFLGPHLQHMEVPRLGVCLELQLLTYTTSTVTRDPSSISYLHRSSWQHWILNSLSGASRILVVFLTCWATMRTPEVFFCELVCF